MTIIRKITEELAIAGQPSLEDLQQLVQAGYRSIVNLRSPDEIGCLTEQQQKAELLGLQYLNLPTQLEALNSDFVLWAIPQIADLPTPVLLHCDSGTRSSIMALIQIAIKQGLRAEQAIQKAYDLGLLPASSED
jgi:uncharacterized protein (TIGR01244 family)